MQLKCVEKTDKSVKIGIMDADTTIVMPIVERLNDNKDVKIVRYIETHPELDMPELYVEMYEGDPIQAIVDAGNEISEYFSKISE
jgi:DNA-directed RNA polymerase subunit L